jgi:hypothetical protein
MPYEGPPLELPDYAVLCGRVEALLEGYFDAFDQQDLAIQMRYLDLLRAWLIARQDQRAAFNAAAKQFADYCRESLEAEKKSPETVTESTDCHDSTLAKPRD